MIYINEHSSYILKDIAPRNSVVLIRYKDFLSKDDPVYDAVRWCNEHFKGRPWDWSAIRTTTPFRHNEAKCHSRFYFKDADDATLFRLTHSGKSFTMPTSEPFNTIIDRIQQRYDP